MGEYEVDHRMVTQVKRRVTIRGFVVKKTHPMRRIESTRVMTDFDRIEWISLFYRVNVGFSLHFTEWRVRSKRFPLDSGGCGKRF